MNRTEALQAAFMIAGPNVTADEHIQYAEFLLGDQNVTYIKDWITVADTKSICDEPREYTPHEFIGQPVFPEHWSRYPVGAVVLDSDQDVWYHEGEGQWTLHLTDDGDNDSETYPTITVEVYGGVFVA